MLGKKLNIKNYESSIELQNFKNYDEKYGTILISTEIGALGTIAYMNERAAIMLKVSSAEMIRRDFNQFIPKPFSLNHNH
ncbi:unnamed protein product [Blepharisma stoltei]|uniref:PAS domain-containing protein n=1 Tax=Blepharisma stoltei TaxID=1481888 RepID=A0AAU9JSW7_9CILI|nr:unnamed protein product [Blepharisma stoltei]